MIWTILIIKKSDNGWYINYIEQKILKQISINNLQNFVNVIVFDPKIKFDSKYVSVIDNYIEISDSFVSDIYNIMSNSNADCIGLKGLNYIDSNSCTFSNISDGSSLLLPITTLNPIKLDIIVSKLQNIHYYINSENLSNVIQSIDSINTPVIFMQDTTNKLPFSIIITAYQTQNYIEECLDSIENQSYFKENDNYEILVGVDACQDTFDKLNEIKHKYRNLKIYMMNDNKGTYITTNTLIGLTKHENIIRFDSDDIMTPNLVKELVKDKGSSDIVLLGYLDFEDNIIGKKLAVAGIIYFKKSVMDIAGGYQPWRCAADTELISRLANKVKIHQLKKAVFYRRIHENSLTRRDDTKHDSEIRNYYTSLIKRNYSDNEIKIERVVNKFQSIKKIVPISIIVTAYQTQNYIEECLDSIENQTYFKDNDNYEVLLGIDACEETLNKVKGIMYKYRNLRVFMMDSNMGTYVTSNTLLDLIQYENILRFDSDDIMKSFMIEEIMQNINNYDLIQFKFNNFYNNDIKYAKSPYMYANGCIFYKKNIFVVAGGYKDWLCSADLELLERIKEKIQIKELNKSLFYRRNHISSLCNRTDIGINSEFRKKINSKIRTYNENENSFIDKKVNTYREYYLINYFFDHIYCINLDRRIDKWKKIEKKFYNLNINVERFSAIDGLNLTNDDIINFKNLNKFEIGCLLSHQKIIRDAKNKKYKNILIFEDDILFIEDFHLNFCKIVNKLPKNWKMLYLGSSQYNWTDLEYFYSFYYTKHVDGTFAYAINESIYDDILNGDLTKPADYRLWEIQQKYYKNNYVCFPNLIISDVNESDIRQSRDNNIHSKKMKWNLKKYE